jgi:hypothetical protein
VAHLHISDNLIVECSVEFLSAEFIDRRISGKMDADPLTADSPLSMSSATSMAVESTSGLKLSKEEEDYLEKLMAEKKTVDQTAALDLTQKLLNAGICLFNFNQVEIFHLMRLSFDWWPSIEWTAAAVFASTFVKSTTVERGQSRSNQITTFVSQPETFDVEIFPEKRTEADGRSTGHLAVCFFFTSHSRSGRIHERRRGEKAG